MATRTDIQVRIVPDGAATLPPLAREHGTLASKLSEASPGGSAPDWRDVEREISGDGRSVTLRVRDVSLSDYDQSALDAISGAVSDISGVQQHPDGWQEVEVEVEVEVDNA